MATIRDIARISGYSIGTVSRVINNRADVSERARKRIEEVIRQENYQPNINARMLRQDVSSEISVIVRGYSNIFFAAVLEKIQIRVREHGESANVVIVGETDDEVAAAIQLVQNVRPKGLIFLGGSVKHFREEFSRIELPSVLVTVDASGLGYDNLASFTTDDIDAGRCIVRKLIGQGHRRIGILGGYPGDISEIQPGESGSARIRGALEELQAHGVGIDVQRDYEMCPYSSEEAYHAARRLLQKSPDLTAVFALSDSMAFGAVRAFRDMGLRVPEDISVVGFDGLSYTRYSCPRLDTVRQDTDLLARKSVDSLLLMISYGSPAVHERISYTYVDGESVAPPCR